MCPAPPLVNLITSSLNEPTMKTLKFDYSFQSSSFFNYLNHIPIDLDPSILLQRAIQLILLHNCQQLPQMMYMLTLSRTPIILIQNNQIIGGQLHSFLENP
ncbi:hypothetical protein AAHE18_04G127300 [Arachis hypogaea]